MAAPNFFQYKMFIHAKLPRVKDGEGHCPTVQPPWARKGSGFTLLFEALVMELAKHLPVAVIAVLVGVTDKRWWRFIRHYVDEARGLKDCSDVSGICMDETSRKGHNYITVMADLDKRTVLYATEGKDHSTIDRFVADFKAHGGDPDGVRVVTCDMSLGFRKGIADNLTEGQASKLSELLKIWGGIRKCSYPLFLTNNQNFLSGRSSRTIRAMSR